MENEIEATFLSIDKDAMRAKLRAIGFELAVPEYTMRRKTFDFSKIAPGLNKWGRVREESGGVTMTIKEARGKGIDDMYEVELSVDDFDKASMFFEACNIPEKSFQENLREVWKRGLVVVTIDSWPGLDPFIEIEGATEPMVRATAEELRFDFDQAVFGSIDLVYELQ